MLFVEFGAGMNAGIGLSLSEVGGGSKLLEPGFGAEFGGGFEGFTSGVSAKGTSVDPVLLVEFFTLGGIPANPSVIGCN